MRARNINPRTNAHFVVHFLPHERRRLQRNIPPEGSSLGGMGRHENWLLDTIDATTGLCPMTDCELGKTIRYIQRYGQGGPNGRIREACTPALRRIGIDISHT